MSICCLLSRRSKLDVFCFIMTCMYFQVCARPYVCIFKYVRDLMYVFSSMYETLCMYFQVCARPYVCIFKYVRDLNCIFLSHLVSALEACTRMRNTVNQSSRWLRAGICPVHWALSAENVNQVIKRKSLLLRWLPLPVGLCGGLSDPLSDPGRGSVTTPGCL